MTMINGMTVVKSPFLPKTMTFPVKEHIKTDSMSEKYHQRIQKKWNKRFGFHQYTYVLQMGHKLMCHPDMYEQLLEAGLPDRAM